MAKRYITEEVANEVRRLYILGIERKEICTRLGLRKESVDNIFSKGRRRWV